MTEQDGIDELVWQCCDIYSWALSSSGECTADDLRDQFFAHPGFAIYKNVLRYGLSGVQYLLTKRLRSGGIANNLSDTRHPLTQLAVVDTQDGLNQSAEVLWFLGYGEFSIQVALDIDAPAIVIVLRKPHYWNQVS